MQGIDQPINGGSRVLLGDMTEMRVTRGRGGARMTEQRLDMA